MARNAADLFAEKRMWKNATHISVGLLPAMAYTLCIIYTYAYAGGGSYCIYCC